MLNTSILLAISCLCGLFIIICSSSLITNSIPVSAQNLLKQPPIEIQPPPTPSSPPPPTSAAPSASSSQPKLQQQHHQPSMSRNDTAPIAVVSPAAPLVVKSG